MAIKKLSRREYKELKKIFKKGFNMYKKAEEMGECIEWALSLDDIESGTLLDYMANKDELVDFKTVLKEFKIEIKKNKK
jgi:hypothetical protein